MPTEVLYLGPPHLLPDVTGWLAPFRVRHAEDPDEVDLALRTAAAVLDASMAIRFDAERIQAAGELRLIATATTGASHIDREALADRSIPLLTLAGDHEVLGRVTPAAEHSWALVLAVARRVPAATAHVLQGGWDRTAFPGSMLRGKTMGVVGLGRLGRWVACYADAFGMEVLGCDPDAPTPRGVERTTLDEVLRRSDVVSLHVPLTPDTQGLLDEARIGSMKQGAILVNTSRGEVVDEGALVAAMRDGRLGGLGIDVLGGEPDVADHPIIELARTDPRVVVTPHIGGFSPEAVAIVVQHAAGKIRTWFESHGMLVDG